VKRQITGILLLLFLLVPFLGTYSWLHYQKRTIRKSIKHKIMDGLDKDQLVLLKFKKSEAIKQLEWEHSKEFEYKDEMYDVVDFKSIGDSVYYWCWWDSQETALNKQLNTLLADALGGNERRKNTEDTLISFFKFLYYSSVSDWNDEPIGDFIKHYEIVLSKDYSITLASTSPPPELAQFFPKSCPHCS